MPWKQGDRWLAWVRDAAGVNRKVSLAEARTREQAKRLEADLRMRARRQREGLDPLPTDRRQTVGELLRWWLDTYVAGKTWARQEEDRFRLYFEGSELGALPVALLDAGRVEVHLQSWTQRGLAPASVNKLRAMVRTAWNRARKAGRLHGENPTRDVSLRKVPKRAPAFLEAHEVPRLLAQLTPSDRLMGAAAIYAGLRKGELCGMRKTDVDLGRRLLTVRRSYGNASTKGGREEAVPIAAGLVPYLESALDGALGELLFPKADGSMRTDGDALGERLHRAMGRAGIVTGYLHSCRRCKSAEARKVPGRTSYAKEFADNERRRCPACNMVLWAKPVPKKFRLHDTRHTTATLLLSGGADLFAVSKILRHSDPKITFETYAHLVPGYLHDQIDKLSEMISNSPQTAGGFPPFPPGRKLEETSDSPSEGEVSSLSSLFSLEESLEGSSSLSISLSDATPVPLRAAVGVSGAGMEGLNGPESALLERCAWPDSNGRPAASKAAALSS